MSDATSLLRWGCGRVGVVLRGSCANAKRKWFARDPGLRAIFTTGTIRMHRMPEYIRRTNAGWGNIDGVALHSNILCSVLDLLVSTCCPLSGVPPNRPGTGRSTRH